MKTKLFAAVMTLVLVGCERTVPETEPVLRSVKTLTIGDAAASRSRTYSGLAESAQASRLSFKVAGTVTRLPVRVGSQLSAGDLVAQLDPSPFQLQAQQAQASLVQAQANQRNADANYERVKGLYENNNASRNDLDSARAAAESAEAQVRAAEKALELARLNVEYTTLSSGGQCSVASLEVEINENVASGTPVAVVNCGGDLDVRLTVPEGAISLIELGAEASIAFSAVPGRTFTGKVVEVGVSSSANAATFPVVLRVLDDAPVLRPGLAADVTFVFATGEQTRIIPLSAVTSDQQGDFVYLARVGDGGEAEIARQPVVLGELTEDGVEVRSGLTAGDRVVTAGVSFVRPGQKVLLGSAP